jgi:atypical dual specificity phosphatase
MSYEKAVQYYNEKRFEEAIEEFNQVVMRPPVNQDHISVLGCAYFNNKELVKARGIFEELVTYLPTYEVAKANLSLVINHMVNSNDDMTPKQKIRELKLALYHNYKCFEAWYNIATYYTQVEPKGETEDEQKKYKARKLHNAYVASRMVSFLRPDDVDGLLLHANVCLLNKKWAEAITSFDAVLEKQPEHKGAIDGKIVATQNEKRDPTDSLRIGYLTYYYNGMQKICDGLWIGSRESARDLKVLKSHNITHILNMTVEEENLYENTPEVIKITYKRIGILDNGKCDILENGYLAECFKFIDEAIQSGGQVLVHCQAGISRSGAIVVAYLMKKENLTYEQALEKARTARFCIEPNGDLQMQIRKYFEIHRPPPPVRQPTPPPPPLNLTPTIKTFNAGVSSNFLTNIMLDIYKK